VAHPEDDTWRSEGSPRANATGRGRACLDFSVLCTCACIPTEAGRWDPRKGWPACRGGGVRARVCLAAGACLTSLEPCTCAFVPTEAGGWDPRKWGPACRRRWAVRTATSLGARCEAPRSPASSFAPRLQSPAVPSACGAASRSPSQRPAGTVPERCCAWRT
jgi:hypothetical protein